MANKKVMVTCYDASFARLLTDTESVDYILVGDSLGMVVGGFENTLTVTMHDMIYHTAAVCRGVAASKSSQKPIVIADMPVGSYDQPSVALENAELLMKAGAEMVKLEGPLVESVRAIRSKEIPVCGHIGLTPQTILDFKVQGKVAAEADRLITEAKNLEAAGVQLLVLEMLPGELAKKISSLISIPTIGIGAGVDCGGQVLVLYDLLGFNPDFNPKFLKKYADGATMIREAVSEYAKEVRSANYPDDAHSFHGAPKS